MSNQTRFRSIRDQRSQAQQEEEYIRQLQEKKKSLQQATAQKYKSMLQNCYKMQEMGNDININLKGQTQKLENIHSISNDMKKVLKKANETSKQMASFWYSIGKKIKKVFIKEKDDQQDQLNKNKKQNEQYDEIPQHLQKSEFTKFSNTISNAPENQQDAYLDQLSNQVKKLIYVSKNTNKQITKQTRLINSLDNKTDENSNKIEEINKRIKKNFF